MHSILFEKRTIPIFHYVIAIDLVLVKRISGLKVGGYSLAEGVSSNGE